MWPALCDAKLEKVPTVRSLSSVISNIVTMSEAFVDKQEEEEEDEQEEDGDEDEEEQQLLQQLLPVPDGDIMTAAAESARG